ncbi:MULTISPECIES: NCS2 family permease [Atopobiaceae]|uniref:MFS transporter, AGZA family, xanthine/uracil permease n=1 Tax=Parafannyhessea umbonata TaxID=604330 RepID=A0A1H6IDU1_9ACTN|nr:MULTISPECIES: NCS2 family permease [Atopobiaceae]SEH44450.1 putative MFS transporter, AGZA family, xanthine/uracil permease [Parafannyhessea umbonata]SJZ60192.1 putative MFS transporter, AGZA family, xanthine/uracil permease [Olsenella sp. KH1P3]
MENALHGVFHHSERGTGDGKGALDRIFHLSERGTNVKTEILAGVTTFVTAAYILAVNPSVLAATGMPQDALFTATVLISTIGTLMMALLTNYPFILCPGMGINAYFAYTVCLGMGYSWQTALGAIFVEGIIFVILSLTNVREAIFNAIPMNLKFAITSGVGLFITIIGLKGSGLVIPSESTLVTMFSFHSSLAEGTFSTAGICALLSLIGIIVTAILVCKNVCGNILLGILITWGLGIVCQFTGLYVPNAEAGFYSLLPDFSQGLTVPSIAPIAFQIDFSNILSVGFMSVVFAFLFTNLFDTIGTLIGSAAKADLLDEEGKLPNVKGALLAESLATTFAGMLGTSSTATAVECTAGISQGGRTGLTGLTCAVLFLLSLFLSPIFLAIPSFATSPALVIVGFMMFGAVTQIEWGSVAEAIPAFVAIIAMPFMYSIAEGISLGIISYVAVNAVTGAENRKKISGVMWVLFVLFCCKYFFI